MARRMPKPIRNVSKPRYNMHWNATTDHQIVATQIGYGVEPARIVTPAEAKRLYDAGQVVSGNMAFVRLVEHGYDVAKADASYTTA